MIGLALISFIAIFASGLQNSISDAVDEQVNASYVVVSDDNFTPFDPSVDQALASVPGAEVVGVRGGRGKVLDSEENVTGVDPSTIASVYTFDWTNGSDAVLSTLGQDGAILDKQFAEDNDLTVGDRFQMLSPNGKTLDLGVKGIYDAPAFWQMLGSVSIPVDTFDATFNDPQESLYLHHHAERRFAADRAGARGRRRGLPGRQGRYARRLLAGPAGLGEADPRTCSTSCSRCRCS